jgi:hypothetical protein
MQEFSSIFRPWCTITSLANFTPSMAENDDKLFADVLIFTVLGCGSLKKTSNDIGARSNVLLGYKNILIIRRLYLFSIQNEFLFSYTVKIQITDIRILDTFEIQTFSVPIFKWLFSHSKNGHFGQVLNVTTTSLDHYTVRVRYSDNFGYPIGNLACNQTFDIRTIIL